MLDVGCGIGRLTIHYAKNAGYVIGLDISDEMIRIAKERTKVFRCKLEYITATCYDMPFKEVAFDIVNSVALLQHVDEKLIDKSIKEIGRVLTNNAFAILVETAPLRINAQGNGFSKLDSPTFPRLPTYFFSQLEPNNLSLICNEGVNTSLFIGSFLKLTSIFKERLGTSGAFHPRRSGFTVLRTAINVILIFLTLLSITVDNIISWINPAFLYEHYST